MTEMGRRFNLSNDPKCGVYCGATGVFIGDVPLLKRTRGPNGSQQWEPRPLFELNRELGKCYGLPVGLSAKIAGLTAVARALDRGDLLHAQIATLHLQIPDPPVPTKSEPAPGHIIDLVRSLQASGLLKADWNPLKHPRWPAGSPDSIGGEFAPAGSASGDSIADELNAPVIPAQITLPAPFEFPIPGTIPFPSEVLPPPLAAPTINPRRELRNPYPDRPECEEEWATALDYCWKLMTRRQLGRGDHRGSGKTFYKCVMG